MLSGLRIEKISDSTKSKKEEKKDKTEAKKEKKEKKEKKKSKKSKKDKSKKDSQAKAEQVSSSKSSSSASAESGDGKLAAKGPCAGDDTLKRQAWMAKQPRVGEDEFFSRLGGEGKRVGDKKTQELKADPDKFKLSEREYNPFMRGEVSDQPTVKAGSIPSHLKVGDGGSAWRKRSKLRERQEADEERKQKEEAESSSVADRPTPQLSCKPAAGSRPLPASEAKDDPHVDDVIRQMQLKYSGGARGKNSEAAAEEPKDEPEDANELGAMAMQAMLSGDMAKYAELNKRLEKLQAKLAAPAAGVGADKTTAAADAEEHESRVGKRVKVLEEVDAAGRNRELVQSVETVSVRTKGRNKRGTANAVPGRGGELSGFYEDDNVSLDDLMRRERIEGVQDYDSNFANHILKKGGKFKMLHEDEDEAYALGDWENASKKMDGTRRDDKRRKQEINDKQRIQINLEKCTFCMESKRFGRRDAIISTSQHAYVCMDPQNQCVLPDQVFIAPMEHVQAMTDLDDTAYAEVRNYQKCLVRLFESQNPPRAVMFAESAVNRCDRDRALLGAGSHAVIIAYAVEYGLLAEARSYWKKAFDEAEDEFITQHKKVIETDSKGGVRRKIPQNFPYVHIDFALSGGYAHVVEDSIEFPRNFVQQTVAGMCELTVLDRAYSSRDAYRNACADFKKRFREVDWTRAVNG